MKEESKTHGLLPHGGKILLLTNVATNLLFANVRFVGSLVQLSLKVSNLKGEQTTFMRVWTFRVRCV